MNVENKMRCLYVVLDIRTSVLRLVINLGSGTVRLESPGKVHGAPCAVCKMAGGWCG